MSSTIEFDSKSFRRALGNFATGITVVTATSPGGERAGVTANSFNSVSLEPPLVLWSIDKRSGSCAIFEQASHFAVNILAADQIYLSNHFARPADDKFAGVEYSAGAGGAAVFADCAGVFECEKYQIMDGGDHWILLGKVIRFQDNGRAPLLYHQGSYSLVMPFPRKRENETATHPGDSDRHQLDNNLFYLMLQAVRRYQADYQPRQLATGVQTAEARILMSLQDHKTATAGQLAAEVSMPEADLHNALEVLLAKGFIANESDHYRLQTEGKRLSETLWQISREQQQRKFQAFSEHDIQCFRKVLLGLINHQETLA